MIQLLTLASVATAALLEAPLSYTLNNDRNFNTIEVSIGTPAQKVTLALDTGSADTWVPASSTGLVRSFDQTNSSTYSQTERYFAMGYGDGTQVGGYWFQDTLSIGSIAVPEQFMGLGLQTEMEMGTFGMGPSESSSSRSGFEGLPASESQPALESQPGFEYTSFTDKLRDTKDISTVFSTWMAGEDRTGVITFGGYDKSRFEGELNTVPIVSGNMYRVQSEIVSVGDYTYPHPGIYHIDTGAEQMHVPRQVYNKIVSNFSKRPHPVQHTIVCDQPAPTGVITFRFGHGSIKVPLADLINPLVRNGGEARDNQGRKLCIFGAVPIDGTHEFTLGGAFLRSAYVVFDWENQQVSLAQAKKLVDEPRDFVVAKRGIVSQFMGKNPRINGTSTSSTSIFNPFPPQANGAVDSVQKTTIALAVVAALLAISI